MSIEVSDLNELERHAADFSQKLATTAHKEALVVGLSGELGAGKTTFTQAVARTFGIEARITSPTFVIMKIYDIPSHGRFSKFIHIDAYRLQNSNELIHLGFNELIREQGNLIFIEWPERVPEATPKTSIGVEFEVVGEASRMLSYHNTPW